MKEGRSDRLHRDSKDSALPLDKRTVVVHPNASQNPSQISNFKKRHSQQINDTNFSKKINNPEFIGQLDQHQDLPKNTPSNRREKLQQIKNDLKRKETAQNNQASGRQSPTENHYEFIKMLSQQDINLTEKEIQEIKSKLMLRKSSLISKTPDVIKAIKVTKRSRNWDLIHQSVYSSSPERNAKSPLLSQQIQQRFGQEPTERQPQPQEEKSKLKTSQKKIANSIPRNLDDSRDTIKRQEGVC